MSFRRTVLSGNWLHWYWQSKTRKTKHHIHPDYKRQTEDDKTNYVWYSFYERSSQEMERVLFSQSAEQMGYILVWLPIL